MASLSALDSILYMPASERQGTPAERFELAWTEEEAVEMKLERGEPEGRLFCFELCVCTLRLWACIHGIHPCPGCLTGAACALAGR